ncbi:hypothetical protein FCN77_13095 [Arthrobacter sp. 24S4-2]|uniref:hypothetical protein n=1 Tax=Arthrobacter sp. 24S4-2 TaxID=2575374 RepID=UPI0010C7CCE0|nr:hypothetical protein [Arthrobacter sp. 24S4-2]QCO98455.1 hypothetical protein FCN77_13095 [Arthrobacter sp. 24S4-2]
MELPLQRPERPCGAGPSLALAYDSSTVDGLTSSTNNQASAVGDGWSLAGVGSIRQKFAPCVDQGVSGSYDLCGATGGQQFSISFGGRSGQVIKDAATGTYRLQNDDNTRIEYLSAAGSNGTFDGGYWKLTDTSGTQYFFGRNHLPGWAAGKASTNSADTVPVGAAGPSQPCAAGSFAASLCQQAYAWNLDYVLDVQGNSQAFYYTQDTNNYTAQAGTGARLSYVRSSRLTRVDYGMRAGTELDSPSPLRIELAYTPRCTGVDCSKGNDVPTTFACAPTGACTVYSPTFYTDQRLLTVTTRTATSPTAYQNVDVWNLHHSMPDPGDGTKPALWLGSVDHQGANTATGTGGAISDPGVIFSGQTLQNRVWVVDGLAPLDRYRISSIKTVTGASIAVTYQGAECTPTNLPAAPETNTKRCFPQWWTPTTPIAQPARMDYFHIYPVASVATNAGPGATGSLDMLTRYEYQGTPAWKYAGPKYVAGTGGSQLSWSVLAGWGKVKTITGNAAVAGQNPSSITTYLRGLDGTPSNGSGGTVAASVTASDGTTITDSPWLAGSAVETQKFLGEAGAQLSTSINTPGRRHRPRRGLPGPVPRRHATPAPGRSRRSLPAAPGRESAPPQPPIPSMPWAGTQPCPIPERPVARRAAAPSQHSRTTQGRIFWPCRQRPAPTPGPAPGTGHRPGTSSPPEPPSTMPPRPRPPEHPATRPRPGATRHARTPPPPSPARPSRPGKPDPPWPTTGWAGPCPPPTAPPGPPPPPTPRLPGCPPR